MRLGAFFFLVAALVFPVACFATYSSYTTYTGPTDPNWVQNGSTPLAANLVGSAISSVAVPDGSYNYEASAKLNTGTSSNYVIYLEATSNAL